MKWPILLSVFMIVAAGADPKPDGPREISAPVRDAVEQILKDPHWSTDIHDEQNVEAIQALLKLGEKSLVDMIAAWEELRELEPAEGVKQEPGPMSPKSVARYRWLLTINDMTRCLKADDPSRNRAAAFFVRVASSETNPIVQSVALTQATTRPTGHAEDLSTFIEIMADKRQTSSCGTL